MDRLTDEEVKALIDGTAAMHPAEVASLATEVKESREAMDALRHEGYEEGMRDGQAEATGAQADFWTMALRYFKEHGAEPASDDGEGHNAYQMMDALFEHVRNIRAEKDARIAELEAEGDITTADMLEIVASGGNGSELVELPAIMSKAAKELREKDARIAELEAERDAWKANAIACGKMLQSFTPGGSEYFGREINGAFPTDSEACGAVIRGKMESLHEARKSVVLIGRERDAALACIAELEAALAKATAKLRY